MQVMGVAAITIILTNYFTHSGWLFWGMRIPGGGGGRDKLVGCQSIEVNSSGLDYMDVTLAQAVPVWQVRLPKMISEGSTR